MHEISLIRSIFNALETEFSPEEMEQLSGIDLQIGELSNVEPLLLQSAFEAVTSVDGKYQHVKLEVEVIPIEIHCDACDANSPVKNYKFVCAQCGTPTNNVVKGLELLIHRVYFDAETVAAS